MCISDVISHAVLEDNYFSTHNVHKVREYRFSVYVKRQIIGVGCNEIRMKAIVAQIIFSGWL